MSVLHIPPVPGPPDPRGGDHPDHLAPGDTHHRAVIVLRHKLVQSKVELAPAQNKIKKEPFRRTRSTPELLGDPLASYLPGAGAPAAAPAAPAARAAREAGPGSAPRDLLVHRAQVQREAAPASRAQLHLTGLAVK